MAGIYSTQRWRRRRKAFLAQHPLCVDCQAAGYVAAASHVDHRIPIARGGDPWDEANLQALCHACHSRKTASSDGAFGNATRSAPKVRGCDVTGAPLDKAATWWRDEDDGGG